MLNISGLRRHVAGSSHLNPTLFAVCPSPCEPDDSTIPFAVTYPARYDNLRNIKSRRYPFSVSIKPSSAAGQTRLSCATRESSHNSSAVANNLINSPERKVKGLALPVRTLTARRNANNALGMKYAPAPASADQPAAAPPTTPAITAAASPMAPCAASANRRPRPACAFSAARSASLRTSTRSTGSRSARTWRALPCCAGCGFIPQDCSRASFQPRAGSCRTVFCCIKLPRLKPYQCRHAKAATGRGRTNRPYELA
ncbi:uncharacterized protein AruCF_5337 [Achromobacter ruhlandii]|nr:uncharacterized protein AruCF_5337 [Achromobacter ruhlandii]